MSITIQYTYVPQVINGLQGYLTARDDAAVAVEYLFDRGIETFVPISLARLRDSESFKYEYKNPRRFCITHTNKKARTKNELILSGAARSSRILISIVDLA